MADISVERKPPSVWPWVIGLLVLALIIWALVEMFGGNGNGAGTGAGADTITVDTPGAQPSPPPAGGTDTAGILIPDTALP